MFQVATSYLPYHLIPNTSSVIVNVVNGQLPDLAQQPNMTAVGKLLSLMVDCLQNERSSRPTAETCAMSLRYMVYIHIFNILREAFLTGIL